jgi:hypothetical protein
VFLRTLSTSVLCTPAHAAVESSALNIRVIHRLADTVARPTLVSAMIYNALHRWPCSVLGRLDFNRWSGEHQPASKAFGRGRFVIDSGAVGAQR